MDDNTAMAIMCEASLAAFAVMAWMGGRDD